MTQTAEDELERQRTIQQNNCLHKYIACLSDELNAGGFDLRKVITMPVKFTPENVKETMIKPIMESLYPNIDSTAKLNTKQIQMLYEAVNAATAERLGVSLMWPDRFNGGKCA